jgi:hypothetical protein
MDMFHSQIKISIFVYPRLTGIALERMRLPLSYAAFTYRRPRIREFLCFCVTKIALTPANMYLEISRRMCSGHLDSGTEVGCIRLFGASAFLLHLFTSKIKSARKQVQTVKSNRMALEPHLHNNKTFVHKRHGRIELLPSNS